MSSAIDASHFFRQFSRRVDIVTQTPETQCRTSRASGPGTAAKLRPAVRRYGQQIRLFQQRGDLVRAVMGRNEPPSFGVPYSFTKRTTSVPLGVIKRTKYSPGDQLETSTLNPVPTMRPLHTMRPCASMIMTWLAPV